MHNPPSPGSRPARPRPAAGARLIAGLVFAAAVVAGITTACSSSSSPSHASGQASGQASSSGGALAFSACMRSHGVPNFPDPTANGLEIPANINARSPAFKASQQACRQFLPNKGEPPATDPHDRAAALAFAVCMRAHGFSGFPDPALTPPRAAMVLVLRGMVFAFSTPIDPKAPAFRQAATACRLPPR